MIEDYFCNLSVAETMITNGGKLNWYSIYNRLLLRNSTYRAVKTIVDTGTYLYKLGYSNGYYSTL